MFHLTEQTDRIILKYNTPGTAGGPGGRDRTLAVKSRKSYIPREKETCSQFNENGTYELPIIRE